MLNFYPDENFYKNIWQQQILILILQTIEKYNYHAKDVQYKINDMKQITISIILLLLIGGTALPKRLQHKTL